MAFITLNKQTHQYNKHRRGGLRDGEEGGGQWRGGFGLEPGKKARNPRERTTKEAGLSF